MAAPKSESPALDWEGWANTEEAALSKAELSYIAGDISQRGVCVSLKGADTGESDLGLADA